MLKNLVFCAATSMIIFRHPALPSSFSIVTDTLLYLSAKYIIWYIRSHTTAILSFGRVLILDDLPSTVFHTQSQKPLLKYIAGTRCPKRQVVYSKTNIGRSKSLGASGEHTWIEPETVVKLRRCNCSCSATRRCHWVLWQVLIGLRVEHLVIELQHPYNDMGFCGSLLFRDPEQAALPLSLSCECRGRFGPRAARRPRRRLNHSPN